MGGAGGAGAGLSRYPPRGEGVPDDENYALGQGAGFYVNATEAPWSTNFRMWDYITEDLPRVLFSAFPLDESRQSIMGHSMGATARSPSR